MSRTREIELKLEVDAGAADLLRASSVLRGAEGKSSVQVSIYFDTPEWELRKAGFSLRVRRSGERFVQTIKQVADGSAGLFDRPEWEEEIAGEAVDFAAAEATPLGPLLGKKMRKRLQPIVRSEVLRTKWDLRRGAAEIELILDEGTIAGGGESEAINEIEVELMQGEPASLIELARDLAREVPVRLGVVTKADRGFGLADGSARRATKAERMELKSGMTTAEGFAAIAYACIRHFRLNEPLVISARDPLALHQARVAMRRLRSAFSLFRPVIADADYGPLREELRWFTDQLGDARNLDVLLKRLPSGGRKAADPMLVERLRQARETAYGRVLDALGSARLRMLMLDLVAWIETGPWRSHAETADRPLTAFAVAQLDKRWRKVKKGGRKLAALHPEARHRLRIEIKKLRYATEFLASLEKRQSALSRQKAFGGGLAEMQEHLGELNDFDTARGLLTELTANQPGADAMMKSAERLLGGEADENDHVSRAGAGFEQVREAGPYWR